MQGYYKDAKISDTCVSETGRLAGTEGSIFVIWVDPPHDVDYASRTHQIMAAARSEISCCDSIRIVHNYEEMMSAFDRLALERFGTLPGREVLR